MTAADEGFEILDRATCLELLATAQVGRLAWAAADGRVHIRPVNYTLAGADIIVRTAMGSILEAALAKLPVTFEADELEPALETGWSVVISGVAEDLGSTTEAALLRESVRPWARGSRPNVVRIRASEVTGRRLHPRSGAIVVVRLEPGPDDQSLPDASQPPEPREQGVQGDRRQSHEE
jgi:nitroimidazol reductase NimA-like FMN-containing flavoprotein (pyridoxamine 5'-phosphate oxidase superfamily)